MGYSTKIKEKERLRILAQKGHKAQVKESFNVARRTLTLPVSLDIQRDIDRINSEINALDKKSKDYPQNKERLQKELQKVSYNYAIPKADVEKVQDELNKILGDNKSS